jgi:hypothetical protein
MLLPRQRVLLLYQLIWGGQRHGPTIKGTHYKKETEIIQSMVLLGQHVELDSLGITSSWSPLYASSGTPIWALYTKCSFQVYILTGAKDKILALS